MTPEEVTEVFETATPEPRQRHLSGGRILWLTGLPGSGKTTLSRALRDRILPHPILLDGDELRAGLSSDLGFEPGSRHEQARRAAELAVLLAAQRHTVIVALVSPFRADRDFAATLAARWGIGFAGVFLSCPAAIREQRIGRQYDCPYEPPLNPGRWLQTDSMALEPCVEFLMATLLKL